MKKNNGKWNNKGLASFFPVHISLRLPHDLKAWNTLIWGSHYLGDPGVSLFPPPHPPNPCEKNPIPFVCAKTPAQIDKPNSNFFAEIYRLNTCSRCWKFFRILVNVFSSSGSCMNQNFFYGQHNLAFLVQPFCRLVLPHAHCSSKRNGFFLLRADYMTLYEPGRFTATLLPHGSLIVIWSPFRHIYFHEPTIFLAETSIYRTGADGVRSCLATKPISTF